MTKCVAGTSVRRAGYGITGTVIFRQATPVATEYVVVSVRTEIQGSTLSGQAAEIIALKGIVMTLVGKVFYSVRIFAFVDEINKADAQVCSAFEPVESDPGILQVKRRETSRGSGPAGQ